MVDDLQAQPMAEGQQQPAPMPSAQQQVPQVQAVEPASPDTSGVSTQPATTEAVLPDDARERTKQEFEKLKTQLAREREQRLKIEQMFTNMRQPVTPTVPDYYNPETGEVDVTRLEARNQRLEQELSQIKGTVQSITDKERISQEQETYASYPELDPNRPEKFNQVLHRAVTGYLTDAYLRGENPSFKEAADAINGIRAKEIRDAEKTGATKALEQLTPKEQASLEAIGRSDKRQDVYSNIEQLQYRSRKGDDYAVAERLSKLRSVGN